MKAYKLIDLIQKPVSFVVYVTGKNGLKVQKPGRLVPGREYYDYLDDPVFCESIRNLHMKINHTPQIEDACKAAGIKYTLPPRTCSCQKQQIDIWYVEVIE